MQGLILKDYYVITKQLRIFLIFIPVFALTGGSSLSIMAILLGAVLPMTAIAYDERSKWNELAVMMPYSKKDLVISKYLLGYICMFGAAVLVILGHILLQSVRVSSGFTMDTLIIGIYAGLIFIAINTPVLFKFGSEKGRFVFFAAMVLIGASGSFFNKIGWDVFLSLKNIYPLVILLGILILNFISIQISIKIKMNEK